MQTPFTERNGEISPDGWLAYEANDSGSFEIYVRPFPGAWVLQVISRGGLDGRGTGDLAISSDGALTLFKPGSVAPVSPDVLRSLVQYIRTTTPSQWAAGSRLSTCSDCFATLIVLTLRESDGLLQTHTVFWDVTTKRSVAADVLRIHDLALTLLRK